MQCFRFMGMPDKVLAFDELPEDLVRGFEMCKAEGFPKYWKNWLGKKKVTISIPSELNPVTGQRTKYEPIVEEDSYFYLVDSNVKPVMEKWKEIEDYVRRVVPTEFRLTDKLEDMAKPLAPNKTEGINLEPDDVVVIPIPKGAPEVVKQNEPTVMYKCDAPGCEKEYDDKRAIRMHKMKAHPEPKKEEVAAV